jgi:hypothetical protein
MFTREIESTYRPVSLWQERMASCPRPHCVGRLTLDPEGDPYCMLCGRSPIPPRAKPIIDNIVIPPLPPQYERIVLKTQSPEHRAKLSAAQKKRFAIR